MFRCSACLEEFNLNVFPQNSCECQGSHFGYAKEVDIFINNFVIPYALTEEGMKCFSFISYLYLENLDRTLFRYDIILDKALLKIYNTKNGNINS